MNIYLEWTETTLSKKMNFPLFDLEISQEEGCFAKARLVIDALSVLPSPETEGVIIQENKEILFRGLLVGNFVKIEGAFGEIELLAKPLDFLPKMRELQKANRLHPYWDLLWVHPDKQENFEEIQDVRAASLFCNPRTGELSLSDWFEGRETLNLHQKFFHQSLKLKLIKSPLQACTVNVHAHWVQWIHGISNLGAQIRKAFPHKKVSTYTEKAILEKWPKPRKRLGRSGLWVLKSELKPVIPLSSFYPTYSPVIPLEEGGSGLKNYRAKRYWFKPTLWVRWKVRQKRKETLSLTLHHAFQLLFPGEGKHKTIEFTLQNINPDPGVYPWQPECFYQMGTKIAYQNGIYKCTSNHSSSLTFEKDRNLWIFKKNFHTPLGDPARASFFLTDRGRQAAEHAMERAKVILAKSSRCLEVTFEGSWDDLKEVTTDKSIVLSDPRLPGGEVKGKVVKHVLIAKGETGERTARVTLLCAVGKGEVEPPIQSVPIPLYSLDNYGDESYQVHENQLCYTSSGLSYFRYDTQIQPECTQQGPFVRGIQLINGPHEQEAEMLKQAYKSPKVLKKALSLNPTRLQIFFKDLRTKERLDHRLIVTMAAPWSAPRQFSVGKE